MFPLEIDQKVKLSEVQISHKNVPSTKKTNTELNVNEDRQKDKKKGEIKIKTCSTCSQHFSLTTMLNRNKIVEKERYSKYFPKKDGF